MTATKGEHMLQWPFSDGDVTCVCGKTFHLYWNGGELDRHLCGCGRLYYTEHRETVLVTLEPGEGDPRFAG